MYVSRRKLLTPTFNKFSSTAFICLSLLCESKYSELMAHVPVYCYHYPCGRIKLVLSGWGMFFTGKSADYCSTLTFDSVRSLYNVPGVRIHTDISDVYAILGMNPRYRD